MTTSYVERVRQFVASDNARRMKGCELEFGVNMKTALCLWRALEAERMLMEGDPMLVGITLFCMHEIAIPFMGDLLPCHIFLGEPIDHKTEGVSIRLRASHWFLVATAIARCADAAGSEEFQQLENRSRVSVETHREAYEKTTVNLLEYLEAVSMNRSVTKH